MNELGKVEEKTIVDFLDAMGLAKSLTESEKKQFLGISMAFQLNPFKREIYCIAYGEGDYRSLSIITGYETYLKRADRSGKLKGWKCWTEGIFTIETKTVQKKKKDGSFYNKNYTFPVGDLKAKIQIYKEGWDSPFEHEVYLDEYAQANEMWGQKPRTMLKKVCTGQGFRLAFPDELGGMPYLEEEIDGMRNVTPEQSETVPCATVEPTEPTPTEPPKPEESKDETDRKAWAKEWSTRLAALSKKAAKWPADDRNAMELGDLVNAAKNDKALMDLVERRAALYDKYKADDRIDSVMQAIKDAGRDLDKLTEIEVAFDAEKPEELF